MEHDGDPDLPNEQPVTFIAIAARALFESVTAGHFGHLFFEVAFHIPDP
jgi:hypothetical protein